jgi:hypothetical protein
VSIACTVPFLSDKERSFAAALGDGRGDDGDEGGGGGGLSRDTKMPPERGGLFERKVLARVREEYRESSAIFNRPTAIRPG